jgi:hypothetical protein
MSFRGLTPVFLASTMAVAGCSRSRAPEPAPSPAASGPVTVTDIDVGRSVASDQTISERTDVFRPGDTFYVAARTDGSAPSATLAAKWSYGEQPVAEFSQTIAPNGPTVTTFQLPKPSGPDASWPAGEYKVAILLNGTPVGSKAFRVL